MSRQIHYDRARVDLAVVVTLPFETVWRLLEVAIPDGRFVDIVHADSHGCIGRVRSWAKVDIGSFTISWRDLGGGRIELRSALVQSILHSTSVIPLKFGKGSPQALGGYRDAMDRVRTAVEGHVVPVAGAASVARADAAGGWHPDPYRQARLRWFDGNQWTAHVAP